MAVKDVEREDSHDGGCGESRGRETCESMFGELRCDAGFSDKGLFRQLVVLVR